MRSTGQAARGWTGALALVAAVLVTAGCTSNPVGPPTSAPATGPAPTRSAAAAASTPPPTQTAADATPVTKKCSKLVPRAVAQTLVSRLAADSGWAPAAGTPAARLADLEGTTCRWTDPEGDVLEVAGAKPSAHDATALKNDLVERSQSAPTYGGEAYFQVTDHVGEADVFRGRTWILARSNRFYEPGDATAVVQSALKAMGYGPAASPTPSASASAGITPAQPAPGTTTPAVTTN